ncbi:MAG: hypothetical protein HRF51_10865 [bacterium]|jgi:hypothetical protein
MTLFLSILVAAILSPPASAHCDTYNGPVVKDARLAIEEGDVTPVLKWVGARHEAEIRILFEQTISVARLNEEARSLAQRYFFETLVRLHREGEGAPYTGLKPSGTPLEPGIEEAEEALTSKSAGSLLQSLNAALTAGINERFAHALETREHAGHTVEAGREYVAAYIEFIHYVERLHQALTTPAAHHEASEKSAVEHKH